MRTQLVAMLLSSGVGPGRRSSGELRHETVIDAPIERVWEALTAIDGWPEWNPTLKESSGPLVAGTEVSMKLQLGPFVLPMRQTLTEVDRPHRIRWTTRQVPRIFEVARAFELEPVDEERTRLTQFESGATWLASKIVPLLRKPIEGGYRSLAEALADRVEVKE